MSTGGQITLRQGLSSAEEFSTLAHGLAHEMLHRDKDCGKTGKKVRETEAVAVVDQYGVIVAWAYVPDVPSPYPFHVRPV